MGPEAAYPVHSNANIHSEGSADGDAKADKAGDGDVDSELEPEQQVTGIKGWGRDGGQPSQPHGTKEETMQPQPA